MNRSLPLRRAPRAALRPWLGTAAALLLAIVLGLLLARLLLAPPMADLRALALYLLISGAATLGGGWLTLRLADQLVGLTIRAKFVLSIVIGTAVALLNVCISAQLMFINTGHDLKLLTTLLVFSGVVTLTFGLWVVGALAGRLTAVATGIRSLASGAYEARIRIPGGDEVAELARHVNDLAGRLQAAETERAALDRERRELTAAVAHDLRTPLASVRAMVEALDDDVVSDPADVRRYHGVIRREIDRLNRMIDDLFVLAQLDAGALRLNRQPVDVSEIAAEVVDAMQEQARRGGVSLTLAVAGVSPDLALDGARIERALANLVRNALAHTPAGGAVSVTVAASTDAVTVTVRDSGEGIDPADLPRIWERFYRAERSRGRASGASDGAGLGLAIVRGIIEAHGGQVAAASQPGHGATFRLCLPLTAA